MVKVWPQAAGDEESPVFPNKHISIFTYYLVIGLKTSSTDIDCNGWISKREAFDYSSLRTTPYVQEHGQQQHPQFFNYIPNRDSRLSLF
jgi:hypothetical protein